MIITGVGAGAFAASQALLSDQAVLAANTFSTGTSDLLIATNPVSDYASSKAGFTNNAMLPGQTSAYAFRLKNNSDAVDFSIQGQATINGTNTLPADKIFVTITPLDSSSNPMGTPVTHPLNEWTSVQSLGDLVVDNGDIQRYKMEVMVDPSITESSVSVNFDFVFTGTQVLPSVTPSLSPSVTAQP